MGILRLEEAFLSAGIVRRVSLSLVRVGEQGSNTVEGPEEIVLTSLENV